MARDLLPQLYGMFRNARLAGILLLVSPRSLRRTARSRLIRAMANNPQLELPIPVHIACGVCVRLFPAMDAHRRCSTKMYISQAQSPTPALAPALPDFAQPLARGVASVTANARLLET